MCIPGKSDRIWYDILMGNRTCNVRFLAAKILIQKLCRSVKVDPSQENIEASIDALHIMFANNMNMPIVRDDLKSLLGDVTARE